MFAQFTVLLAIRARGDSSQDSCLDFCGESLAKFLATLSCKILEGFCSLGLYILHIALIEPEVVIVEHQTFVRILFVDKFRDQSLGRIV